MSFVPSLVYTGKIRIIYWRETIAFLFIPLTGFDQKLYRYIY